MKNMKIIITLLLSLFALSSCVKEPEYSGDELEARSLKAWIKKNRPELVGNYQEKGGYYVDVLSWGDSEAIATSKNDFGGKPIMEQDTCWVYYNFTGYDLDGNVCATRNEVVARMQASFSDRTHYVPYGNYCGKEEYYAIVEGSYLASRNKITLSEEYVASKPNICRGKSVVCSCVPSGNSIKSVAGESPEKSVSCSEDLMASKSPYTGRWAMKL